MRVADNLIYCESADREKIIPVRIKDVRAAVSMSLHRNYVITDNGIFEDTKEPRKKFLDKIDRHIPGMLTIDVSGARVSDRTVWRVFPDFIDKEKTLERNSSAAIPCQIRYLVKLKYDRDDKELNIKMNRKEFLGVLDMIGARYEASPRVQINDSPDDTIPFSSVFSVGVPENGKYLETDCVKITDYCGQTMRFSMSSGLEEDLAQLDRLLHCEDCNFAFVNPINNGSYGALLVNTDLIDFQKTREIGAISKFGKLPVYYLAVRHNVNENVLSSVLVSEFSLRILERKAERRRIFLEEELSGGTVRADGKVCELGVLGNKNPVRLPYNEEYFHGMLKICRDDHTEYVNDKYIDWNTTLFVNNDLVVCDPLIWGSEGLQRLDDYFSNNDGTKFYVLKIDPTRFLDGMPETELKAFPKIRAPEDCYRLIKNHAGINDPYCDEDHPPQFFPDTVIPVLSVRPSSITVSDIVAVCPQRSMLVLSDGRQLQVMSGLSKLLHDAKDSRGDDFFLDVISDNEPESKSCFSFDVFLNIRNIDLDRTCVPLCVHRTDRLAKEYRVWIKNGNPIHGFMISDGNMRKLLSDIKIKI